MEFYQQQFIELAIKHKALCFGEFTLKSGRVSPYFFNAGRFQTGAALAAVAAAYAERLTTSSLDIDMILGPAYKGIPIAATMAAVLADKKGKDYPYCYNRKEIKNHGEGGVIVGAPLKDRVLIVDDVITAGTAIREVINIINASRATPAAVLIGFDRQEKGQSELSAIQEIEQEFNLPVLSIIKLDDIIDYMNEHGAINNVRAIEAYRDRYGV